jgi:cytoskeletal protein CcmA (bactofilin family)
MTAFRLAVLAAALAASALQGCDSDSSATAGIDAGGVRQPVTAQGPISGFGSIIVGGVHYDIDRAQITVNGAPGVPVDLALGQLVTVVGRRDGAGTVGEADSVAFDANVEGPVQAVDAAAETLVVLGQPVTVGGSTVFDLGARPARIESIAVADTVQVSGFIAGDGAIAATRITLRSPSLLRVRGTVAALDAAAARFGLNALTVDYRTAAVIEGFAGGAPANGDDILVLGTRLGSNGELVAEQLVRIGDDFVPDSGEEAEVEGLITRFVAPADFDVAGVPIAASDGTAYEGGSAGSLQLNVKVQVEGRVNTAGVIDARKIEVKDGGRVVGSP